MKRQLEIVGIGEALFDVFPDEERLGGAPLNAAAHAHALVSPFAGRGVVLSRVGQDEPGERARDELASRGLDVSFLQTDPDHPTGQVFVGRDASGNPTYEILDPAAWDMLSYDPDAEDLARRCRAVTFGSLAQRHGQARNTIYRFLTDARQAIKLFDVNLRQDAYNRRILQRSLELADAVKCNDEEIDTLRRELGLPAPDATADTIEPEPTPEPTPEHEPAADSAASTTAASSPEQTMVKPSSEHPEEGASEKADPSGEHAADETDDSATVDASTHRTKAAQAFTAEPSFVGPPAPLTDDDRLALTVFRTLLRRYALRIGVFTRGERGTVLVDAESVFCGRKIAFEPEPAADAVGAGDACTAAVLTGLTLRWDRQTTADLANRVGAFVAARPGATPRLPENILGRQKPDRP